MKLLNTVMAAMLALSATAMADNEMSKEERERIENRLKPVGSVCVQGDDCGGPAVAAASGGARSGEDVYKSFCTACHSSGVLGAPKTGDAAAWNDRLAKGFETVLSNAINGINAMPPRGTCGNCSDDEIAEAIRFMSK